MPNNLENDINVFELEGEISVGGGGTSNYDALENKPQINGVELVGNMSLDDLGIAIPTKTSELDNDSGFVTSEDIPTKTSELDNDSGYVTSEDIPTKTSQLQNDSGFITGDNYYDKSEIDTALSGKADKSDLAGTTNISSGSIANFDTSLALPLVSCSVDVSATKVFVRGANLWDEQWEVGSISDTTGGNQVATTVIRSKNFIRVKENTTLYCNLSGKNAHVFCYGATNNYLGYVDRVGNGTVTTLANTKFIRFRLNSAYGTTYNHDVAILYPSTKTNYVAWNNNSSEYEVADIANIITLSGSNNIFTDNGDISVTYRKSISQDVDNALNQLDYVSNALYKYNCVELLSDAPLNDKVTTNISITWSGRTATITGTPTTATEGFVNIFHNSSGLPDGFIAGKTVYFEVSTTNYFARLGFIAYDGNGATIDTSLFDTNGVYTIPSNAVGITVRLALSVNKTFSYDTFTAYIYTAPSNLTIEDLLSRVSLAELRIGKETKEPMLTIIDDDGNSKFYTDLYPLATSKKVSIASAIPFSVIGTAGHLTLAQVQEMFSDGVEILNHSYAHDINYDTWTERDFEDDYRKAKNSFSLNGISTNVIIYVGASSNKTEAVEAAKNVFVGGITSGSEHINYCTGDKYQIERYGITDSNNDGRINGYVLSQLTNLIDTLKTNGGWMIWMLHTSGAYWNNTMLTNISSAIDYAISEGVPIVSAECGFRKYYGN